MTELSVRMRESAGGLTTTYEYEFRSSNPDGAGPLEQEYVAEPAPALVRKLCEKIDDIVGEALGPTPASADPAVDLARTSQVLYDSLFPRLGGNIPDLARRIRDIDGPLLVRTNESLIPWELLHDGTDFLGLTHEVGRRTFVTDPVAGGRTIGSITRALIVGDPNNDLESARREAEQLAEWLTGHGVECTLVLGAQATLLRVVDELASGGYDLLHYCGHVAVPVGTKFVGLRLHGDELLDGRALMPLANASAPPMVFINGCASADRIANLCVSFMKVGAKVVVGTRYAVEEEPARRFAERFYTDVISGSPAGAAIRSARRSLQKPGGVDWAAFVLYGDPSVRISTGDMPSPGPRKAIRYRMDPAATKLMDEAIRQAAPHGVVTSTNLLVGLLSTEDMQNAVGAERLVVAKEVLRTVLSFGPIMPTAADVEVEFSDTVETVLARAEQRAQESGRDLITTGDLVASFVAVGGGSSRVLLELFGISLNELPQDTSPPRSRSEPSRNSTPLPVNGTLLFDEAGNLRTEHLDPTMVAAIRVAALLAATQRTVISTSMLLYGLGIADSQVLGDALREQGDAGVSASKRLSLSTDTHWNRFSPRTRRALEKAAAKATAGAVPDSAILSEIISEKTSSARELLNRLGVDPDRLLRSASRDVREPPADGEDND